MRFKIMSYLAISAILALVMISFPSYAGRFAENIKKNLKSGDIAGDTQKPSVPENVEMPIKSGSIPLPFAVSENSGNETNTIYDGEKKASGKIKIFIKSKDDIEIYSDIDEETWLITRFTKRSWGTWGLEGLYNARKQGKIPSDKRNLMAGEGTDWEYVLRVASSDSAACYFSGGNHKNEQIKYIYFLSLPSGKSVDLIPGKIIEAEQLKIVEYTTLKVQQNEIGDYANVRREYTFYPASVKLASRFEFLKDVYLGTTYVSMFPILKKYGRYIKFNDHSMVLETEAEGSTKTAGEHQNYVGQVEALSAVMWGDENPRYKFRTWIKNSDMVNAFDNELKTFVWDVNRYGNKLYFSKYDARNLSKITSGTVWENLQGWDFIKEN